MPAPIPAILRSHPEYGAIYDWNGWAPKTQFARRLLAAEVMWALRKGGPVNHSQNAPEVLRQRMIRMGSVMARQPSKLAFSLLMRELAGQDPHVDYSIYGTFIGRETNGKRTKRLWALDHVDMPPDPYELAEDRKAPPPKPAAPALSEASAAHEQAALAALARLDGDEDPIARIKRISASEGARVVEGDERSRTLATLRERSANGTNGHGPPAVVDVELPPVELPPEVEAAGRERVDAVVRLETSERSDPLDGLLDGEASLAEKALAMMRLAGEVYTESLMRQAVAETAVTVAEAPAVADKDEQAERLGKAMEQVQILQKRLRDRSLDVEKANASAAAAQAALSGERVRREMAESNLQAIAKGDRVPDESGFRVLRKTMQEKPRTPAVAS